MSLVLTHFHQLRHQRNHEHSATNSDKPTHRTSDQTDNHARKEPNHNRPLSQIPSRRKYFAIPSLEIRGNGVVSQLSTMGGM
jgi:hypothetical protein